MENMLSGLPYANATEIGPKGLDVERIETNQSVHVTCRAAARPNHVPDEQCPTASRECEVTTNRRSRLFPILTLLIAGAAATVATPARADPASPYCVYTGTALSPVNFGTVTVPRTATVGSQIGTSINTTLSWSCPPRTTGSGPNGYVLNVGRFNGVPDTDNSSYVATGITGVGVEIAAIGGAISSTGVAVDGVTSSSDFLFLNIPFSTTVTETGTTTIRFRLIKTGTMTGSGPISSPSPVAFDAEITAPVNATGTRSPLGSISGTLSTPTCTANAVTVTLPGVFTANLTPVGHTAGATPFTIGLICPAGISSNLFLTLTDSTTPANRSTNLSLAPGSTASGLAIRINNSSGAVSYGPDSSATGNPGQFAVGTVGAAAKTVNVSLTASYISTGTVTPGTVNALATFTMSYQ